MGLRTDGRTVGRTSDVITKSKFFAFTGYQIILAMGLRSAPPARSSANNLEYLSPIFNVPFQCYIALKKKDNNKKIKQIKKKKNDIWWHGNVQVRFSWPYLDPGVGGGGFCLRRLWRLMLKHGNQYLTGSFSENRKSLFKMNKDYFSCWNVCVFSSY